jgi:WD40 repeat protein
LGIAFSRDGTMLASASSEGLVHVWHRLTDPAEGCRLAADFISRDQLLDTLDTDRLNVCFQDD